MKLLDYKSYLEANLSLADLNKPDKEPGKLRGDVLVRKLRDQEKIKTNKKGEGEKEIILNTDIDQLQDDDGNYDPIKAKEFLQPTRNYQNAFAGPKSKSYNYKLNDIVKVADFGSSGGSSLGNRETRIVESIQTLIFAWKQNYSKDKYMSLTDLDNEEILNRVCETRNAFIPVDVTPQMISDRQDWHETFVKTANAFIHNKYNTERNSSILKLKKHYNFYQIGYDDSFPVALGETYRRCCKKTTKLIDQNKSNGFVINIAKWTPSDVWAVNCDMLDTILKKLKDMDTIEDLNVYMDTMFDKRDIIGISLKKINAEKSGFPIIVNRETPDPRFTIKNAVLSPDPFVKGAVLLLNRHTDVLGKESITLMSNSGETIGNINLEIGGSTSRHGKCSLKTINDLLGDKGLEKVELASELRKISIPKLTKMVKNLDSEIKGEGGSEITKGKNSVYDITLPRLISKYQSLKTIKILLDNKISGGDESDSVINSLMHYALAISNRYFVCPKYARVIEYL